MHTYFTTARRALAGVAAGLLLGVTACENIPPTAPARPDAPRLSTAPGLSIVKRTNETADAATENIIGPDGGTITFAGGHSIHFPAGALASNTLIKSSVDGDSLKVTFGPHGTVFPDSAQPVLSYSYTDNTGLTDEDASRLSIVYTDGAGSILEVLTTEVDTTADVIRARLKHFSTYAMATD